MTWDKRSTADMENESIVNLAYKITACAFILAGIGLFIATWIWL